MNTKSILLLFAAVLFSCSGGVSFFPEAIRNHDYDDYIVADSIIESYILISSNHSDVHTDIRNIDTSTLTFSAEFGIDNQVFPGEVIDTSFQVKREVLSSPYEFMKILTDIQMIGREQLTAKNYTLKLSAPLDSVVTGILSSYLNQGQTIMLSEFIAPEDGYSVNLITSDGAVYGLASGWTINNPPEYYKRISELPLEESVSKRFLVRWEKDSILHKNTEFIEKYKAGKGIRYSSNLSTSCVTRFKPDGASVRISQIKYYNDAFL